jgi:UrcA family protein
MKTLLLAAFAVATLTIPLPGRAADKVVSLADLDLASPAGHDEAMLRISRAAFQVCREIPVEGVGQLQDWLNYLDCARDATLAAAAQLPPLAGR